MGSDSYGLPCARESIVRSKFMRNGITSARALILVWTANGLSATAVLAGPGCPCDADLVPPAGLIDADDVLACLDCLGGFPPPGGLGACDINCDGAIGSCDCKALLCQFAGGSAAVCCLPCDGDLTDDGFVDVDDLLTALECLSDPTPDLGCDVECDGDVDACDVLAVECVFLGGDPGCCDWVYGDCAPPFDGLCDLTDLLCALDGYTAFGLCPDADYFPCPLGDGIIDIGDILSVLDAYTGDDCCD